MRINVWGTWGALCLICALMVGCNNTNRQPDKTLGMTTGNPPQNKSFAGTGAPPTGTTGATRFPVVSGAPNNSPFGPTSGTGAPVGGASFTPPGNPGFNPPPGAVPNSSSFIPPNTGPTFANPSGPLPTPNVSQPAPFNSDRNSFPGVKMPGQP